MVSSITPEIECSVIPGGIFKAINLEFICCKASGKWRNEDIGVASLTIAANAIGSQRLAFARTSIAHPRLSPIPHRVATEGVALRERRWGRPARLGRFSYFCGSISVSETLGISLLRGLLGAPKKRTPRPRFKKRPWAPLRAFLLRAEN